MSNNILFVTAYDAATTANFELALLLKDPQDHALLGISAIKENLFDAISVVNPSGGIFMMSHGRPEFIKGNDDLPALSEHQGPLVSGRKVFAWACWTGVRMGHYISKAGCDWWGYDCAITAPDERPKFATIQAKFFKLAKQSYVTVKNSNEILPIINSLKIECEKAIELLYMAGAENDIEAFSIFSTCNQFWERLVVWHPTSDEHFRHPSAPRVLLQL